MKSLRERAEETTREVQDALGVSTDTHPKEIADAVERAIIKALLEERKRCAEVAFKCCIEDQDKAHQVSEEIKRVNTVLVANLLSMR